MAASGQYTRYIPLPLVPWSNTKTFQVLRSDVDTSIPIENLSFHQAESFIAQNGKDRVCLRDFVVFCQHLGQLRIGRVVEILAHAEDSNQKGHRNACKPGASHITLEIYSFDEERHEIWDVPCI